MKFPLVYIQFVRYAIVGVVSNIILFVLYLLFTFYGLGPKLSMSILYATGVLQTFFVNRRWTFQYIGESYSEFIRYCLSYVFGYVVNILALIVCVDTIGWPHQIVQGCMIVVLAVLLFCLQKFWVFRSQ